MVKFRRNTGTFPWSGVGAFESVGPSVGWFVFPVTVGVGVTGVGVAVPGVGVSGFGVSCVTGGFDGSGVRGGGGFLFTFVGATPVVRFLFLVCRSTASPTHIGSRSAAAVKIRIHNSRWSTRIRSRAKEIVG